MLLPCPTHNAAPTDVLSLFKLLLFSFSVHFLCSLIFPISRKEGCWLLKLLGVVTETRWIIVAQNNNLSISWLQLLWIWSNPYWCFAQWIVQKWFPGISRLTAELCSPDILKEEIPGVLLPECPCIQVFSKLPSLLEWILSTLGTPGMCSHHSGCDEELLLSSSELFPLWWSCRIFGSFFFLLECSWTISMALL